MREAAKTVMQTVQVACSLLFFHGKVEQVTVVQFLSRQCISDDKIKGDSQSHACLHVHYSQVCKARFLGC